MIADMVNSRNLTNRGDVQKRLNAELARINRDSALQILSPYTITLGDEFQVLYKNTDTLFADIFGILYSCHPIKMRFSLSIGIISTAVNAEAAIGMDGPAFYASRKQLESLKAIKGTVLALGENDNEPFIVANRSLLIFSHMINKWNKTTLGCFYYLLKGNSRREIVERMGSEMDIKERTVYKALKSGFLDDFKAYADSIGIFLKGYLA